MTRLLLLAILMQGPTSQQMGVVIGHVIRGATPSSAGIPVIARTVEGAFAAVTETDENGGYRFALRPGRYLMSAGLPSSPTYYPGAIESVDAEPITVRNGSTIIGINFPLVNPIDIQVTGRVIIEGGGDLPLDAAEMIGAAALNSVPRPTALMRMISQRIFGGTRASTTVRADGFFSLTLQPGENHIFVQSLPMGYYVRSIFAGTQDILLAPLNITEGALPEVVVTLTRTPPPSNPPVVTVAGRVTGLPSENTARWIMLQSSPSSFGVPAMIAEVPLQADGSFEVRGVPPGDYTVSPLQTALPTSSRVSLFVSAGRSERLRGGVGKSTCSQEPVSTRDAPCLQRQRQGRNYSRSRGALDRSAGAAVAASSIERGARRHGRNFRLCRCSPG